jgi:hypothetical protein
VVGVLPCTGDRVAAGCGAGAGARGVAAGGVATLGFGGGRRLD